MSLHQDRAQRHSQHQTALRTRRALFLFIIITLATSLFAKIGPALSISPASVNFGSVVVGNTSSVQNITLTNTGYTSLKFYGSFNISGPFALSGNTCSRSLAAGSSCSVSVNFTPTAAGTQTGSIGMVDNATGAQNTITLTGTGTTTTPTVSVAITPTSSSLQVSQQQQFSASVSGTTTTGVTWSVNGVAGGNSTVGTITSAGVYSAPASVPSSGSATVTATSVADSTKSASASVAIAAPASSGPVVSLSPTSLNFGSVAVGSSSSVLTTTLTNTGNSTLTFSGNFAITGPFAWGGTGTCGTSVAAGASCLISAKFSPTASGTQTGSITLTDNASSATQTIALTGTGSAGTTSSPSITTTSLPSATQSTAYSTTLSATGGTTPYTWSLASGSLPSGVSLSTSGAISGTPTASGTFAFSVKLTDNTGLTATANESIAVAAQSTGSGSGSSGSGYGTSGPSDPPSNGTTYYVSPTGSDSNPGTQSAPWATIQHAANTATAGALVIVEDGTYSPASQAIVSITKSGTSSAWITFKSQNKWGAKLVGNNSTQYGFAINANYVAVDGFEIYGMNNNDGGTDSEGIEVTGGSNQMILRCHIHNIGNTNTTQPYGQNGIWTVGNNLTIDSNIIHDVGRTAATWYQDDHGIYLDAGSNATVQNNLIYNTPHGWDIQLYPNAVSNLKLVNNTLDESQNTHIHGAMVLGDACSSCVLANNIWYMPTTSALENYAFSGSMTAANNLTTQSSLLDTATPAGFTSTGNVLSVSPSIIFQGVSGANYQLAAGSPAIGAGSHTYAPAYDLNGNARSSSSTDIGAYAY